MCLLFFTSSFPFFLCLCDIVCLLNIDDERLLLNMFGEVLLNSIKEEDPFCFLFIYFVIVSFLFF